MKSYKSALTERVDVLCVSLALKKKSIKVMFASQGRMS